MFKLVVLLSAVACALGAAVPHGMVPINSGRIVGGTDTVITNHPWQVSIHREGFEFCSGAIYNTNTVLTAAHCLQTLSEADIKVRVGSTYWNTGGTISQVRKFKVHEDYNPVTMENDIALIRLTSFLTTTSSVKPIGLPSGTFLPGMAAVVTGWGSTYYGVSTPTAILQQAPVQLITGASCASTSYGYGKAVKQSMICASAPGKDACKGDSGGPLVANNALVGLVSWGYGCGFAKYPGVYTSTFFFKDWIIRTNAALV